MHSVLIKESYKHTSRNIHARNGPGQVRPSGKLDETQKRIGEVKSPMELKARDGVDTIEEEEEEQDEEDLDESKEVVEEEENVELPEEPVDPLQHCTYYLKNEDFSIEYVDELITSAAKTIEKDYGRNIPVEYETDQVPNITWPTISEFTKELGKEKIKEYIDTTLNSQEKWVNSVEFLSNNSDQVSDFYKYEAKFSIPTSCYPIPQATTSLFFTYEVSRVKPVHCPVTVTFNTEGFSLTMSPGKDLITDALLFRVIDAKLAVFRKITF